MGRGYEQGQRLSARSISVQSRVGGEDRGRAKDGAERGGTGGSGKGQGQGQRWGLFYRVVHSKSTVTNCRASSGPCSLLHNYTVKKAIHDVTHATMQPCKLYIHAIFHATHVACHAGAPRARAILWASHSRKGQGRG